MEPAISVVIPCYNEAEAIQRTLVRVMETHRLTTPPRIFVIDAGRSDGTEKVVANVSDKYPGTISYTHLDKPSRGRQLICGAKLATTPFLLFLHADTLLPLGWDVAIVELFHTQNVSPLLGCFELALPTPITLSLSIMVWTANVRAKVAKLPYGDQAYFVRRVEYESVGGFADIPLMEDVDLLRRYKLAHAAVEAIPSKREHSLRYIRNLLHSPSCIHVVPMPVVTSPRRWNRKGVWWNTVCNQFYMLAWMAGVSPTTIYNWYYGRTSKID